MSLINRLSKAVKVGMSSFKSQAYEGATQGRRGGNWHAAGSGPNAALNGSLETLRNRARQSYRNNAWIERGIENNVKNEIGIGITPIFLSKDESFNDIAATVWLSFVASSDPELALNFYGQLAQASRARRVSGEVFIRRRLRSSSWGLSVPLQIQIIEADQVPLGMNEKRTNGNRIKAGKEYNKRGKLVAFWVYPEHPQDSPQYSNQALRIPAKEIIHHYNPLRPGQVRGEPDMVQALLRAKSYDSYEDAELVRKEARAPFTGFLQKEYTSEDDWSFDPLTGEEIDNRDIPEINAQPGTIISGTLGESLTLFDGDNTGQGYSDYQRQQLLAISAGLKSIDVLVSGDWSNINDRIYRAQIGEYRREIQMCQEHLCIHQICERVGRWFTDAALLAGKLTAKDYAKNIDDYNRRDWSTHRWPHIHPTQDVDSIRKEMELDLTSHDAEAAKRSKKGSEIQRKNVKARATKRDLEKEFNLTEGNNNAVV